MKKSLLYTIIGGACLLTTTSLTLIANGIENTNDANSNQALVATTTTLENTAPKSFTKNETVYIITDTAGKQVKSFVDSTLNTSSEPIPVDMNITYTLDGNEISGTDLSGKSGHVKITYNFSATKSYGNKKVPFLTVTGISLDSTKFANIKIDHGKILNESPNSTLISGYTFAGLNEDLGTDFLPESFTISADVTDFELDTTYTFATNELFANLDTSKLTSIDSLINSINDLSAGLDQIISGSSSLTTGLDSALAGADKLADGANKLSNGIATLKDGATALDDGASTLAEKVSSLNVGLATLSEKSDTLNSGLSQIIAAILSSTSQKIGVELTTENYVQILDTIIAQLIQAGQIEQATELGTTEALVTNLISLSTGLQQYTGTVDYIASQTPALAEGTSTLSEKLSELSAGTNQLATGATELSLGANSLRNGLSALATGSHTLYDGLVTFKTAGIDRLVNFANHDLSNFLYNIRRTVTAANSYHHYSNSSATSVKFIFKTPNI